MPDAITASVILLLALAVVALALGNSGDQVMDAYYRGLWMLLPFTMQMTLIIVLSSALASSPFFRRVVVKLSGSTEDNESNDRSGCLADRGGSLFLLGAGHRAIARDSGPLRPRSRAEGHSLSISRFCLRR